MIFNKNYDDLLWYILKTDKQNRKLVLELIKSMPQNFLNETRKAISKYRECQVTNKEFKQIRNIVRANDKEAYGFTLFEDSTLHIFKIRINQEGIAEKISIDLKKLTGELEDNISFLPIEYFGKVERTTIERDVWNPSGYELKETTEYGILKTLSGHYIIKNYSDKFNLKDKSKHINVKRVPTEIRINDLERFNKQKKLSK